MNDFELLREFAERESEPAFAELVRRHIGMVYSAAMRQTADRDVAEDVTQAAFILLARKGPQLGAAVILPGWLYRTACLLARQAAATRSRRRALEKEAMEMSLSTDDSEEVWGLIAPKLDAALAELAEPDRNALILRYLQERGFREVGESLGMSEEAARKRVARGIERLRHILRRQGVTIAAAGLAAVLGEKSLEAMPITLAPAAVKAGVTFGVSSATVIQELAGHASLLGEPVSRSTGLIAALGSLLVVSVALWTAHLWRGQWFPTRPAQSAETASEGTRAKSAPLPTMAEGTAPKRPLALALRVLAEESGEPVEGARITAAQGNNPRVEFGNFITDARGMAQIELPKGRFRGLNLIIVARKRPGLWVLWTETEELSFPAEYTVSLEAGREVSGRVLDEKGRPVPGARIAFQSGTWRFDSRQQINYRHQPRVSTDATGAWSVDYLAAKSVSGGFIKHPDYRETGFRIDTPGQPLTNVVLTIKNGLKLRVVVLDEAGKYMPDALLAWDNDHGSPNEGKTDAQGKFELGRFEPGPVHVTVRPAFYYPTNLVVKLTDSDTNLTLRLTPYPEVGTETLRGHVVNEEGEAMQQVWVNLILPPLPDEIEDRMWQTKTDDSGRFEIHRAPNRPVRLITFAPGYKTCDTEGDPDVAETVLTLERETHSAPKATLQIRAIDKSNGATVPRFRVIQGSDSPRLLGEGLAGSYQTRLPLLKSGLDNDAKAGVKLLIEAPGYATQEIMIPQQTSDLRLIVKLEPGGEVNGQVISPDGRPAADAEVSFRGPGIGTFAHEPGKSYDESSHGPHGALAKTDRNGYFHLKTVVGAQRLAANHLDGIANIAMDGATNYAIRLQPWGRIEGTVLWCGHAPDKCRVGAEAGDHGDDQIKFGFYVPMDAQGSFTFPKVPAGTVSLFLLDDSNNALPISHNQFVKVISGEMTKVTMGGTANLIRGKVTVSPARNDIAWFWSWGRLIPVIASAGDPSRAAEYGFHMANDGGFVAEDVPPGDYRLRVDFAKSLPDSQMPPRRESLFLGESASVITVPASATGGSTFDLGVVELKDAGNH